MKQSEMLAAIEKSFAQETILPDEIPNIDLYMDQLLTFVGDRLNANKRDSEDKLLTKTMINNYSKDGLLTRIHGKTYSKEHILMILTILSLKQTLALQDIGKLFSSISPTLLENGRYQPETVRALYKTITNAKERSSQQVGQWVQELLPSVGEEVSEVELAMSAAALAGIGGLFRRAAEELIDQAIEKKR